MSSRIIDDPITYYGKYDSLDIDSCILTREDEEAIKARQRIENRNKFIEKVKRFEELKKEINEELKKELLEKYNASSDSSTRAKILMEAVKLEKNGASLFSDEEMQQMKEGLNDKREITSTSSDKTDIENEEDAADNQTTEEKIEELNILAEEMEELKKSFDVESKDKSEFVGKCKDTKCISEARAAYELELDKYRMEIASFIAEKNRLVTKREILILRDIRAAINNGEDLSQLKNEFIDTENEISALDAKYETKLKSLNARLEVAQTGLKDAKESVKAYMSKKGVAINREKTYIEGILKSDAVKFPRENGNQQALQTYYPNIMETAPEKTENYMVRALIDGNVITIFTKDSEKGVDNSFVVNGVQLAGTSIGEKNTIVRDRNRSALKDYPEMEDLLEKVGIDETYPPAACDEMEEEQEKKEQERKDGRETGDEEPQPGFPPSSDYNSDN